MAEVLPTVSRADVEVAFQELLGRSPESETVIETHRRAPTVEALRKSIQSSPEYGDRQKAAFNAALSARVATDACLESARATAQSIDAPTKCSVTRDEVVAAFRGLLGREPESEFVIQEHMTHGSVSELHDVIQSSPEFQARRALATSRETVAPAPIEEAGR